jgi:hypothetical protein
VDEFAAVLVWIFATADLAGVDFGDVVYCGSDGDCAEGLKDERLARARSHSSGANAQA